VRRASGAAGTTVFGAASRAFFRFTGGPIGAGLLLAGSLFLWVVLPPLAAFRRVPRAEF
jgi:Cu-processing system permease protein